jgi:hypothetical protein
MKIRDIDMMEEQINQCKVIIRKALSVLWGAVAVPFTWRVWKGMNLATMRNWSNRIGQIRLVKPGRHEG